MRRLAAALLLLMVALLGKAALAASPFDALAGQWQPAPSAPGAQPQATGEIALAVEPADGKVRLRWTLPASGPSSATFAPAGPPGVYGAVEGGMFGLFDQHANRDPLADGELLWLRATPEGFTLYSLEITDAGGYRLDRMECVRDGDRLQVRLARRQNGKPEESHAATLARVGG